jgi:hypothetical protein
MGEQGYDKDYKVGRGAQAVEDRPICRCEGLATLRTDEAPVLTRMNANIALADLASGWTCQIRAACRCGVHACPPSSVGERPKRSMCDPPFILQANLTTV